jgi:hypothetical protein
MAGYAFGFNPPWANAKPAAHFCGRVLGGTIDFDQNTTFHWTSQMKIEVFFHRGVEKIGSRLGRFRQGCAREKAVRIN